jgi:hypothetical protein
VVILKNNDKLYIVKREIRKSQFTDMNDVKAYMEFIHAEHVLQDADKYIFCLKIDDVEFEEMPL